MATPTGNTLIARGNRFRVHSLTGGGWRIGFTTRLGYRDFPPAPSDRCRVRRIRYHDHCGPDRRGGRRPDGAWTYDAGPRAPRRLGRDASPWR